MSQDKIDKKELMERLELLSADDLIIAKSILSKIGLKDEKADIALANKKREMREHLKSIRHALPQEYDLIVLVKCLTCGTEEEMFFHMKQSLDEWGLVSDPIIVKPTSFKHETFVVNSCRNCEKILMQKSSHELIQIIFTVIDRFQVRSARLKEILPTIGSRG